MFRHHQICVMGVSVSRGGLEQPSRWGGTRVAWRSRIKWDVWCLLGRRLRGCCKKPKIITTMLMASPITVMVKNSTISGKPFGGSLRKSLAGIFSDFFRRLFYSQTFFFFLFSLFFEFFSRFFLSLFLFGFWIFVRFSFASL
jgi:hypothetical protein